jgi:hypothetical protein
MDIDIQNLINKNINNKEAAKLIMSAVKFGLPEERRRAHEIQSSATVYPRCHIELKAL